MQIQETEQTHIALPHITRCVKGIKSKSACCEKKNFVLLFIYLGKERLKNNNLGSYLFGDNVQINSCALRVHSALKQSSPEQATQRSCHMRLKGKS